MKRLAKVLLACLIPAVLSGCAGRPPTGAKNAQALLAWLGRQEYSQYQTFRHSGAKPSQPLSPDGLTLGSPNVFAGIGAKPQDLTSLDVFWSDRRTVRPLAKPLTIGVLVRGRRIAKEEAKTPVPLSSFPDQVLRRICSSSIAVSESRRDDLKVTIVDFAPMALDGDGAAGRALQGAGCALERGVVNPNLLCRWFTVENTAKSVRRVTLVLKTMAPGEAKQLDGRALRLGDGLAIVSDAEVRYRGEQVEVEIGRVDPGERASAAVLLTGVAKPERTRSQVNQARAALPHLLTMLDGTLADWRAWRERTLPARTGDARTDDLLDSLLCLLRAHIGANAIHTGALKYSHGHAWVRDSYWVQRALLELGCKEEAKLNLDFFHRAWRASGIASSYEIATLAGKGYGYQAVELPHYFVLMVRDAERLGDVRAAAYWDMVSGCMDRAAVPTSGLQPMNGDETWLLASPVRELDSLLDNSWLLIASAEYAADLAARVGDAARAHAYRATAARARAAVQRFLPRLEQSWLAVGYGADGSLDLSLCPEVLARAVILGVLPASDPRIASGLAAAWDRLNYERGIRTHARSATVCGGTPGYVLWATADTPGSPFTFELARRVLEFASATGCVWEFHDLHDPAWGGEKRRLWDSAVVLTGLVKALFARQSADEGGGLTPRKPTPGPAPTAPPFDAERLVKSFGKALILHQASPQHAARLALELARQRNSLFPIAAYSGRPPAAESAIIISRSRPSAGWRQVADYWVREWDGPPQIWVQNKGHVFLDTDRVINDLVSHLTPLRGQPLPFPPAHFDLIARLGQPPSGIADVRLISLFRRAAGRLDLAGGQVKLVAGAAELNAKAWQDEQRNLLRLTVTIAPRQTQAEATVTFPAGWWLVYARDMEGRWDRVRDPAGEIRLPDGRIRLDYTFQPSDRPTSITLSLARLRTK